MRCTSSIMRVIFLSDATTGGPSVKLGTKWPSITSTCSMRHPAASRGAISSPKRAKSAARMDGRISTIEMRLHQCYHGREKAISGVASGQAEVLFGAQAEGLNDV